MKRLRSADRQVLERKSPGYVVEHGTKLDFEGRSAASRDEGKREAGFCHREGVPHERLSAAGGAF
jgi:hypothetical protein